MTYEVNEFQIKRIRYNNSFGTKESFPIFSIFKEFLNKAKINNILVPFSLPDSISDLHFHNKLGYILDGYDLLPNRPDLAFNLFWSVYESYLTHIKNMKKIRINKKGTHNKTIDINYEIFSNLDSDIYKSLTELIYKIPFQTSRYITKRLFDNTLTHVNEEQQSKIVERAVLSFGEKKFIELEIKFFNRSKYLSKLVSNYITDSPQLKSGRLNEIKKILGTKRINILDTKYKFKYNSSGNDKNILKKFFKNELISEEEKNKIIKRTSDIDFNEYLSQYSFPEKGKLKILKKYILNIFTKKKIHHTLEKQIKRSFGTMYDSQLEKIKKANIHLLYKDSNLIYIKKLLDNELPPSELKLLLNEYKKDDLDFIKDLLYPFTKGIHRDSSIFLQQYIRKTNNNQQSKDFKFKNFKEMKLEDLINFLVNTLLYSYRNERIHANTSSILRSSTANMENYAHAYYCCLLAYYMYMVCVIYEYNGKLDKKIIVDSINNTTDNFLKIFEKHLNR
jgi:hypothetical protein